MQISEYKKIEEFEKDYWWHQGRLHLLKSLIHKYISVDTPLNLFELGCGTGATLSLLAEFGKVGGIDVSKEAIQFCIEKRFTDLICGDISLYNFSDHYNKYDAIFALDVLEHIQDDVSILKEASKMLKSGGKIFITAPAHKFLWSEHDEANMHKRRYHSIELLHKVSEGGFKILKNSYFVMFAFPPMAFYKIWKNVFRRSVYPESSYVRVPKIINTLGIKILKFETKMLQKIKLPIGTTLVIVAEKV